MIRHSVIFKLAHPADSSEELIFMEEARKLAAVPGVRKFEVMKQISSKNPFSYGISMEFENQEAYDLYSNHTDHLLFVEKIWIPSVTDFLEIDYLID